MRRHLKEIWNKPVEKGTTIDYFYKCAFTTICICIVMSYVPVSRYQLLDRSQRYNLVTGESEYKSFGKWYTH
jgi:hypothetical protein